MLLPVLFLQGSYQDKPEMNKYEIIQNEIKGFGYDLENKMEIITIQTY